MTDTTKSEPKDSLTYVYMMERIHDHLHNMVLKRVSRDAKINYRTLRLIANKPDYKPDIDVVNDIYKKLIGWNK